jgi:PRC-barrel domain
MRISDLIGKPVYDEHGEALGDVHDVHLVQDGPLQASGNAALRLHGLLAGPAAVGTSLGYGPRFGYGADQETRGPAPIRALFRLLHRRATYIEWRAVRAVEHDRIVIDAP